MKNQTLNASSTALVESIEGSFSSIVSSSVEFCTRSIPTPPPTIHGILNAASTMILSAPSKGYKTWTLIDLAICLASGSDWLTYKTTPSRVLYLNFELKPLIAQQRVNSILAARKISPLSDLHIGELRGRASDIAEVECLIQLAVRRLGINVVIIDPWYSLCANSNVEENSNTQQAALLSRIEALAASYGVSVIIAHHFAKGKAANKSSSDRGAGAGVLSRWPDVIATLTDHAQAGCSTLEFTLRDFAAVSNLVLAWQFPLWQPNPTLDPSRLRRSNRNSDSSRLTSVLRDGMTSAIWCKQTGLAETTFRHQRDRLLESGAVVKRENQFFFAQPAQIEAIGRRAPRPDLQLANSTGAIRVEGLGL